MSRGLTVSVLAVVDLRCEHLAEPLGVDESLPRLSWRLQGGVRGVRQTAYQLRVGSSREALTTGQVDLWDTGVVSGSDTLAEYAGRALEPRQIAWWQLIADVVDASGATSQVVSPPASWTAGAAADDWLPAEWIGAPRPRDQHDDNRPAAHLRRRFVLDRAVVRGHVHVTAAGLYTLWLNGQLVSDDLLRPGWTDYGHRIQYQTYDVTDLLRQGDNTLGGVLGDGWFCGYIGPSRGRDTYGADPLLRAVLVVELADGSTERLCTTRDWEWMHGPIRASDMLMGETYDARLALPGWSEPSASGPGWQQVLSLPGPTGRLVGQHSPPVRRIAELKPQSAALVRPGSVVVDFGQNLVGWVRLSLPELPAGTAIRLRHAEMLTPDGGIYTENLRSARSTDTYISAGGGERWEPSFTFHGFRYVEVTGLPEALVAECVTAIVVSSDLASTLDFDCDNELVRQLQSNVVWGQRGNFLEVPTDCPQRDERLGWMGDAQIFARTACYTMDVQTFLTKWLNDVEDATLESGAFPDIAPRVIIPSEGSPAWGDAGVIVPSVLYEMYGDLRLLARRFEGMSRWVEHVRSHNPSLIWREHVGNNYGEWLSIDADTPKDLLATAYFAYSARLTAQTAGRLGRHDAAGRHQLADDVAAAFRAEFVRPDGSLQGDTQAAYVHALRFGLLESGQRSAAEKHLIADVERRGVLTTGFLGVAHLLPALTDAGRLDLAYRLLLNEQFPSWGYSIRQGATTIWERWDGWTEKGGFQTPEMNSFNHYSFGSVAEWLHGYAGGLRPAAAGWTRATVQPRPGGGLRQMSTAHHSPVGLYACDWRLHDDRFELDVDVPANGCATVILPVGGHPTESRRPLVVGQAAMPGASPVRREGSQLLIEVGSGSFEFSVDHADALDFSFPLSPFTPPGVP